MEDRFTERQWRAITRIESLRRYGMSPPMAEKPIIGPAFALGEFFIAYRAEWYSRKKFGPPAPTFWVYERTSLLRASANWRSSARAIAEARGWLQDVPAERLVLLIQSCRETNASSIATFARVQWRRATQPKAPGKRRREIFAAGNGRCHYCGRQLVLLGNWHVDHKMPKALGGTNDPLNLVAACAPCNRTKHDKTDVEFKALLATGSA